MNSPVSPKHEQAITLFFFGLTFFTILISVFYTTADPMFRAMMKLSRESDLLMRRYVGELSPDKIFADAWRGMQQAIPFQVELVNNATVLDRQSESPDWGLTLSLVDKDTKVLAITKHSPFAGVLQPGDLITKVGDESENIFANLKETLEENLGRVVPVVFRRDTLEESSMVSLNLSDSLPAFALERIGDIIYLSVARFQSAISQEIANRLEQQNFKSSKGMILDLRYSTGGCQTEASELATVLTGIQRVRPLVLLVSGIADKVTQDLARNLVDKAGAETIGSARGLAPSGIEDIDLIANARLHISAKSRSAMSLEDDILTNSSQNDSNATSTTAEPEQESGIACERPQISGLVFDLIHKNMMLDFVVASGYPALPTQAEETKLFSEFQSFLSQRNYHYDPVGDALKDLETHKMTPEMLQVVGKMKQTQGSLKTEDLTGYREEITRELLVMIQQIKIGGQPAVADRIRLNDFCLKEAVHYIDEGRF